MEPKQRPTYLSFETVSSLFVIKAPIGLVLKQSQDVQERQETA